MNNVPFNLGRNTHFGQGCQEPMDNQNILHCIKLNEIPHSLEYSTIVNETLRQQI